MGESNGDNNNDVGSFELPYHSPSFLSSPLACEKVELTTDSKMT
jgi:hypothetical protein